MTTEDRHPAVFLDRDGTLIEDVHFPRRVDDLHILAGVPEALRSLRDAGYRLIVLTNQSGIARGYLTERTLQEMHAHLLERLGAQGASLDAFYYCPHHPTEGSPPYRTECECRKPAPGLMRRAESDWNIDLSRSFVVGDTLRDLKIAGDTGCQRILVRTGKGEESERELEAEPGLADHVCDGLLDAANWILGH
ncbi:MAG: D-glycero-beta-D-manno-heptose 1,7-bisphosphate 7-phosphatase [Planctomycetota bacterium]